MARRIGLEPLETRNMMTTMVDLMEPALPGDANCDGIFDTDDIVQVLQGGMFQTGQPATWAEGDWNGDGNFNQLDVVAALATGNFTSNPATTFVGNWVNLDTGARGMTRLLITQNGSGFEVQAWGACSPTDCNWGATTLHMLGDSVADSTNRFGFATWDHGFKTTHLSIRRDNGGAFIVDTYDIFKDGSGRSNYNSRYVLAPSGELVEQSWVAPPSALSGTWINADPDTRGMTRLEITTGSGGDLQVRGFGSCHPTDCDWGITPLEGIGESVVDSTTRIAVGSWDHGFKTTHIALRNEGGQLIAEVYNIFTDGSGRSNYRDVYCLNRVFVLPPFFELPEFEPPIFDPPVFELPGFEPPLFEPPVFEPPLPEPPVPDPPLHEPPVFELPGYERPDSELPVLVPPKPMQLA